MQGRYVVARYFFIFFFNNCTRKNTTIVQKNMRVITVNNFRLCDNSRYIATIYKRMTDAHVSIVVQRNG